MSFTPARPVTSPQTGIHDNLDKTIIKHFSSTSKKPIADHNREAFSVARTLWQQLGQPPTILDSACGTGESSRYLAITHPGHLVIGIDQSIKRLDNRDNQKLPDNCLLLRSECTDFWRLAEHAQWRFAKHTLLYPNPYPKPKHLQRRWHGDAAWPSLLAISDQIELRTNWKIYAEEFQRALMISEKQHSRFSNIHIHQYITEDPITAFERKYLMSQHQLWQVGTHIDTDI
jgi:tRNA (guanine-N7-)-methyltransferase